MKLPNMALVFAIIIIPIVLIFSMYVSYQIDTVSIQNSYDSKIITSTKDAVEALEINTFGDTSKDRATTTRRNVQASINTLTNSLATSFGVTGYNNKDILTYVPAVLTTMYDGYYIYSQSSDNKTDDGLNEYVLKPYIYYSARYKKQLNRKGDYDIVVNYSLDNYITVTGTVKELERGKLVDKPFSMSGYIVDDDVSDDGTTVTENGIDYNIEREQLYETLTWFNVDYNMDGKVDGNDFYIGDDEKVNNFITGAKDDYGRNLGEDTTTSTQPVPYTYYANQKYYYYNNAWYTYKETGQLTRLNENEEAYQVLNGRKNRDGGVYDYSAIEFYKEAREFSDKIKKLDIRPQYMIKPDGTPVSSLTDVQDVYYIFKDDDTTILSDSSAFEQHKLNVMQASITYNLNIAISNFGNGKTNFKMPEMSESEWNKILTNVSMVTFIQGMPMGFKTYNNYAVITSTNNEMYVSDQSLYYVINDQEEQANHTDPESIGYSHHKANCLELKDASSSALKVTAYPNTDFNMYTVNYETAVEEIGSETKEIDHYLSHYKHWSYDCYNCIISQNKIIDKETPIPEKVVDAKLHALARIKYNQYKVTDYINKQQ